MARFLLACLLALGVSLQAAAGTGCPTQPKAAPDTSKLRVIATHLANNLAAKPQAGVMLRVSELGSLRLVGEYQLATQEQTGRPARETELPAFYAQFDSAEAASQAEPCELDPETAALPAALAIKLRRPRAPLGPRRFCNRLVRTGRWATRREVVESLTCTDTGPLVLALLPATATDSAQVLAGPGYDRAVPLRPLALTQASVLRLCGDRARHVRAYAMLYNLHFGQADEVARLLDYYNRLAVVQE